MGVDDAQKREQHDDRRRLAASILAFGLSLGATTLAFPLLALEAGFSASAVGLFAALSAALQMVSKMLLPYLFSRLADKTLMVVALGVMVTSAVTLLVTTAFIGFLIAQILQGVARGIFWTSGQTHAVRMAGIATRQLAYVQTIGQIGGLVGPALAGMLATNSLDTALWAAAGFAVLGLLCALTLNTLPPYEREPRESRTPIWKTPGVGVGCWSGSVGGAWRGILDSFVPVILDGAGLSPRVIGWLMTSADGSSLLATATVARWGNRGTGRFVPHAAAALAVGLVALPLVESVYTIALVLVLSGAAAGFAAVLATTSVNESVGSSDQGAALALVGVYRAAARSATPAAISGAILVFSLPVAMTATAIAVIVPSAWLRSGPRAPKSDTGSLGSEA